MIQIQIMLVYGV